MKLSNTLSFEDERPDPVLSLRAGVLVDVPLMVVVFFRRLRVQTLR